MSDTLWTYSSDGTRRFQKQDPKQILAIVYSIEWYIWCVSQIMHYVLMPLMEQSSSEQFRSKFWLYRTHHIERLSAIVCRCITRWGSKYLVHSISVQPAATSDDSVVPSVWSTVEHNTVCWHTCAIHYSSILYCLHSPARGLYELHMWWGLRRASLLR